MKKYFNEHKAAVILAIIVILLILGIGSCSIAQSAAQRPNAEEDPFAASAGADEAKTDEPVTDADEPTEEDSEANVVLADTAAAGNEADTAQTDEPEDAETADPTSTPSPTAEPTKKPAETSSTAAKATSKPASATATPKPAAKETAKSTATAKPAATEAPKATATPKPTEKPKVWVVDQAAWTETIQHEEEGHYEEVTKTRVDPWYTCNQCGAGFSSVSEIDAHIKNSYYDNGDGDFGLKCFAYTNRGKKVEYTEKKWVVDKAAWTETIHHEEVGHWE